MSEIRRGSSERLTDSSSEGLTVSEHGEPMAHKAEHPSGNLVPRALQRTAVLRTLL